MNSFMTEGTALSMAFMPLFTAHSRPVASVIERNALLNNRASSFCVSPPLFASASSMAFIPAFRRTVHIPSRACAADIRVDSYTGLPNTALQQQNSMQESASSSPSVATATSSGLSAHCPDAFDNVIMSTYARYPLSISYGKGARLYTVDGTEYLDFVAGIATCTLGHADHRVIDAVSAQIRKVGHVSNLYYIPEQGKLAAWLVEHSPADKVFFCNSGAEANEAAIKLVRKNWHQKMAPVAPAGTFPVILTAWNSFHGRTLATITATGQPKYQEQFGPLVPGFEYIPFNDVAALEAAADRLGPNLAGIMLEALQGEGGVCPADPVFFQAARSICDRTGALLVADEVQVGVGRTGRLWGFENLNVNPDVFTVAKGLGGGVPIGAMLCTESCNVFEPGNHASTFGGNPLATAAALAVTSALENDGILQNCIARGEQMRTGLENIASRYSNIITEVRGWGLILGVVLSSDAGIVSSDIVKAAMASGLLLVPAGPAVVRFVPPLVVTDADVALALSKFQGALETVVAKADAV